MAEPKVGDRIHLNDVIQGVIEKIMPQEGDRIDYMIKLDTPYEGNTHFVWQGSRATLGLREKTIH